MAHKLVNGNYRHKGVLIKRTEEPSSWGWNITWKVRGKRFDSLKAAVAFIEETP